MIKLILTTLQPWICPSNSIGDWIRCRCLRLVLLCSWPILTTLWLWCCCTHLWLPQIGPVVYLVLPRDPLLDCFWKKNYFSAHIKIRVQACTPPCSSLARCPSSSPAWPWTLLVVMLLLPSLPAVTDLISALVRLALTRCSRSSQRWGLPTNLIPQCTPPLPLPKFGSHWKHANMQLLATY